jgi:hypothetical protein
MNNWSINPNLEKRIFGKTQSMNYLLASLLFIGLSFLSVGQTINNLVPNPGFEDYVDCPITQGAVGTLDFWSPILETPDAFNVCSPLNSGFGYWVPLNYRGYQYAGEGDGYIGMVCYQENAQNLREFAGTNLIDSLVVGETYYTSFKVNLSNAQNSPTGSVQVAIDRVGLHLSTAWPGYNWLTLPNRAQLYATSVISDTANWVTISGSFVADSAYGHLAVGNFFIDDSLTTIDNDGLSNSHTYVFIDDIYIGNDELSVNDVSLEPTISISPNPVVDKFEISSLTTDHWSVQVIDDGGKVVLKEDFYGNAFNANIGDLDAGVYIISILGTSDVFNKRIIKL